ncbi:type I-E CRISPR-associated protein Cas5/CasD [Streptomyces sp. NPDC057654]|uniref:type I-E CRISPR-associated protein Cas5/CasD n=1 Tax=Streptomyces sp. NPDC057654 TaxID=3346196 RepID=UPI0036C8BED0
MSVLIVRLAGPLQSWATNSRHYRRSTLPYPTKSGILGLLAAACGIPRDGSGSRTTPVTPTDLAHLLLAVRIDQPGELLVDYQTVSGASHAPTDPAHQRLPTADDGRLRAKDSTKITRRHYQADAAYTGYLDGDPTLLTHLAHALLHPRYAPFLGRRSCPPSRPLLIGVDHQTDLHHALHHTPWQAAEHEIARHRARRTPTVCLATVTDDPAGTDTLPDQPDPTAPPFRPRYTERTVTHSHITLPIPPAPNSRPDPAGPAAHDPFELFA